MCRVLTEFDKEEDKRMRREVSNYMAYLRGQDSKAEEANERRWRKEMAEELHPNSLILLDSYFNDETAETSTKLKEMEENDVD